MNPCNRLGIRVVSMYRARARRLAATAASLMASALDRAPHHTLPKVSFRTESAYNSKLLLNC